MPDYTESVSSPFYGDTSAGMGRKAQDVQIQRSAAALSGHESLT